VKVIPIASDSMGVRSMATFIKSDVNIIIDPGVALAPYRYGLPPHPIEVEKKNRFWEEIKDHIRKSDVVVITHYHYDHYNPNDVEVLNGKILLLKNPKENINKSQMRRAHLFLQKLKDFDVEIHFCDGKSYEFENTSINFSKPVFHGVNNKLGYVLEVLINDFLYTSDVEGPIHEDQLEFILKSDAEIVFIDGPMTYMLGYRYSIKSFEKSIENIKEILEKTNVKKLVLDHHLIRDLKWRNRMSEVFENAKKFGVKVLSIAEFKGVKEELLEAKRKELYQKYDIKL